MSIRILMELSKEKDFQKKLATFNDKIKMDIKDYENNNIKWFDVLFNTHFYCLQLIKELCLLKKEEIK